MHKTWIVLLLMGLLSACGGGGGGGSGGATTGGAAGAGASPGGSSSAASSAVSPEQAARIEQALQSGNPVALEAADLGVLSAGARDLLLARDARVQGILRGVSSEYVPGYRTAVFEMGSERVQPFLVGDKGYLLATIGVYGTARAAVYGSNLLAMIASGMPHEAAFGRLLAWLLRGDPDAARPATLNVAIGGGYSTATLTSGLARLGITANVLKCDALADASCADTAELVVLGGRPADSVADLTARVSALLQKGKPLLYQQLDLEWPTDKNQKILAALDVTPVYAGNFFADDRIAAGRALALNRDPLSAFVTRLAAGEAATLDWSRCTVSGAGTGSCSAVPGIGAELLDPLAAIRQRIQSFEKRGESVFSVADTGFLRHLILAGDLYRRQIAYPMNKATDQPAFQHAMFADATVAMLRAQGQAQTDLGSFADAGWSSVPVGGSEILSFTMRDTGQDWVALGRYALPGKTFTVELVDAGGASSVQVNLNAQRPASTRLWDSGSAYRRPMYLQSAWVTAASGRVLTMSSPYGGPLMLSFRADEAAVGKTIRLRVSGLAQMPFFDLQAGSSREVFKQQLASSPLSWAEMRIGNIIVHSRRDSLLRAINAAPYKGDLDMFLDETRKYWFEDLYGLAGYSGLAQTAGVAARCGAHGWNCSDPVIHRAPSVQHIVYDNTASCGDGCAGNPIDAAWDMAPRGWGESHETGHNNQPALLRIEGGQSGEVSNNIFPLHQVWRLNKDLGVVQSETRVAYKSAFDRLVAARASADPIAAARQAIWGNTAYAADNGERMAFYMQWVHYWGALYPDAHEGWDIITMLYLQQRLFNTVSEVAWTAERDKLGFGTYASKPALNDARGGNDFMLIALSLLTGRDQRRIFDLWGVPYSSEAAAQAATYPADAQTWFYASRSNASFASLTRIDMSVAAPVWPF